MLGPLKFRNRQALKDYVKPIVNSLGVCEIPPEHEQFQFMVDLFSNHPDSRRVTPVKFSREVSDYGSIVFFYHTAEEKVDFSWDVCCGFRKSQKEILTNTLRNSIKPFMDEFRRTLPKEECTFCKSTEKIQIDHIYPFSLIRDAFLKDRADVPTSFVGNIFHQFRPEDEAFKQEWVAYHNKIATYQPLCKSCNIRKSNRVC
jgi:5-methylcytosine-specific restriction endonuclease McrA